MTHLPRRRDPALAKTRGPMVVKRRCVRCAGAGMEEQPRVYGTEWVRCNTCNGTGEVVVAQVRKGDATKNAREQVRDTHFKAGRQPYD